MNKDLAKLLEKLCNNPEIYKVKLTWTDHVYTDIDWGDMKNSKPNLEIIKYSEVS
ncbi:MAG: hypothetical protein ACOCV1_04155 [Bacillota bacterium]